MIKQLKIVVLYVKHLLYRINVQDGRCTPLREAVVNGDDVATVEALIVSGSKEIDIADRVECTIV